MTVKSFSVFVQFMSDDNAEHLCDNHDSSHARTARQREREAVILQSAIAEFAASGFENARLDDIAHRAGVAKGTLYLYYSDKATLFKAAVRSVIHPVLARIQETVIVAEGSATELLRTVLAEIYREMTTDDLRRELVRLLVAEGRRFPDLGDFYHDEVIAKGTATFRMILWRGVATGEFRRTSAEEFPQLLLAPCVAFSNWQLMFGDRRPMNLDRYAEAHLQFVLAALQTAPPEAPSASG
jgi:AcrR family transcriptional regulator